MMVGGRHCSEIGSQLECFPVVLSARVDACYFMPPPPRFSIFSAHRVNFEGSLFRVKLCVCVCV